MRGTIVGLHRGQRVRVTGAGKRGHGTIACEPQEGATHLYVRDDYSGAERLYPIARIHAERPRRWKGQEANA